MHRDRAHRAFADVLRGFANIWKLRYSVIMNIQVTSLLNSFDALPLSDRQQFASEVLRRTIPFDSGPLDDEEIALAGDALFQELDRSEQA